jgi:hypothetical protein
MNFLEKSNMKPDKLTCGYSLFIFVLLFVLLTGCKKEKDIPETDTAGAFCFFH